MGASVPPLSLSNKAASDDSQSAQRSNPEISSCSFSLTFFLVLPASTPASESRRPFEAELASITLWPEVEKVFGHGYEVAQSPSLPAHVQVLSIF